MRGGKEGEEARGRGRSEGEKAWEGKKEVGYREAGSLSGGGGGLCVWGG